MVRDFRDLVCWKLAYELKCEVLAFIAKPPASRDSKYCNQIRDSSSSAPANIAEGFGRFHSRDAARFYDIARASLMETKNHLIDGHDRGYLHDNLYYRLMNLCRAALKATTSLIRSKRRQPPNRSLSDRIKPSI